MRKKLLFTFVGLCLTVSASSVFASDILVDPDDFRITDYDTRCHYGSGSVKFDAWSFTEGEGRALDGVKVSMTVYVNGGAITKTVNGSGSRYAEALYVETAQYATDIEAITTHTAYNRVGDRITKTSRDYLQIR